MKDKTKNMTVGTANINGKNYPAIFRKKKKQKQIWVPGHNKWVGWDENAAKGN